MAEDEDLKGFAQKLLDGLPIDKNPQITLIDDFECKISRKIYPSKQHHEKLCIYKYCKKKYFNKSIWNPYMTENDFGWVK